MILDYEQKVKTFLQQNFTPSDDTHANIKHTTSSLLKFLWSVFPKDCVSDYELDDILTELGYQRYTWPEDVTTYEEVGGAMIPETTTHLEIGWCMRSPFSLSTKGF